ncbi:MAG: ATP synthase F1 subunit epsilon [Tepidisphaeraceae bacterium]
MAFKCSLVTPDANLFDDSATGVILPGADGQVGILTGHSPLLMKVGAGLLTIHQSGKPDTVYFVDGGVAQMKDDVLTILTDRAVEPSKIDVESARKDLSELEQFEVMNDAQAATRDRKLRRAQAMLRAAGAV